MPSPVTIQDLLKAGAHFGHLTRRWDPKMAPFILMERNGIHIIDLRKTKVLLDIAYDAALSIAAEGKHFLFVGTKPQAREIIRKEAQRCGAFFVIERWLGGMLTNFVTIRSSIRRLENIEKMESDGTIEKLRKKERLMLQREKEKLLRVFEGIRDMNLLPHALFVVDVKREHLAIAEARKLDIPVIALVDTNCDPTVVRYPIPANDDSVQTIELITHTIADAILEGTHIAREKKLQAQVAGEEEGAGKTEIVVEVEEGRRLRPRKRRVKETEQEQTDAEQIEGASSEEEAEEHGTFSSESEAEHESEGAGEQKEFSKQEDNEQEGEKEQ